MRARSPAEADVWGLDLPACVLQPGQQCNGAVTFQPADARSYTQRLLLEVRA